MKALIVGLGRMGTQHARVARAAGCDVVTVDPRGHADHRSLAEIVLRQYDVACAAVPMRRLAEVAVRLLDAGIPTLVEKPGALSPAELNIVESAAGHRDVRVQVGYVERYNPAVRVLRQVVRERGGCDLLTTTRVGPGRIEGDIAFDLLTHDVDLACAIAPHGEHQAIVAHHDRKLRTLVAFTARGVVHADLMSRTVDGRPCEGIEPLRAQWDAFIASAGHGFAPLHRERDVLRIAQRHGARAVVA
jgi:predicted dehydrogenase